MAIIGESFKPYVRTQINIRQNKLALGVKDNDTLKYITSKTSFLRLTSGVNVNKEVAKNLDVPNLEGNGLAKQYVLEAARFKSDPNNADSDFTSGVGYTSGEFRNNFAASYGFNSDPSFGLVPPPGLTSATINTLNRGTIREATINLVCHNLYQFKIINALFLKLKYSLLLEWGHTLYFDNGTKDNPTPSFVRPISIPNLSNDFLNRKGMSSDSILKEIENKREESCGNYDAFFGVIKNFNWELSENGSYNITIIAISQGSVIESLKINSNLTPNENISGENPLYQKSTFHYILGKIREKILNGTGGAGGDNYLHGYITAAGEVGLNSVNVSNFTNVKINNKNPLDTNSTSAKANNILTNQEGLKITFPNLQTYIESNTGQNQFYIKLGTLLRLMESFLLYYDTTKDSNPSIFHFNYNFITGNDCVTIPHHISTDPLTCLIPLDYENNTDPPTSVVYNINTTTHTITLDKDFKIVSSTFTTAASADSTGWPDPSVDESLENQEVVLSTADSLGNSLSSAAFRIIPNKTLYSDVYSRLSSTPDIFSLPSNPNGQNITIITKTISPVTKYNINTQDQAENLKYMNSEFRSKSPYIGKTMHIYVNIGKIIDILDKNVDDEGNISVHSFLTQLLSDVKYALGGINKFDLNYDSVTNTFSIIDTAVIPYKYQNLNKKDIAKFNINLLKESNNGGGSFVTNFSLKSEVFSKVANAIAIGAQDNGNRMLANSTPLSNFNKGLTDRIITNKENINTKDFKSDQGFDQFSEAFAKYNQYKRKFVSTSGEGINENDINLYRNYLVDLFNYDLGTYTSNGITPGTGFIPLNLQLTMDGLSGLTQYQTFEIDETLLPDEYKNRLGFITTTISHKIDSKGWETTINSLGVPKKFGKETKVVSSPPPKVTEPSKSQTKTTTASVKTSGNQANVRAKYGEPGDESNLVMWTLPYTLYYTAEKGGAAKGKTKFTKLKVHKDALSNFDNAFKEILREFGIERIKELGLDSTSGLHNVRANRNNPNKYSLHSWGIAIDLLVAENPNVPKSRRSSTPYGNSKSSPPSTFSTPEYAKFITIMEKNGLYSLGKWGDYDWQHFQTWPLNQKE